MEWVSCFWKYVSLGYIVSWLGSEGREEALDWRSRGPARPFVFWADNRLCPASCLTYRYIRPSIWKLSPPLHEFSRVPITKYDKRGWKQEKSILLQIWKPGVWNRSLAGPRHLQSLWTESLFASSSFWKTVTVKGDFLWMTRRTNRATQQPLAYGNIIPISASIFTGPSSLCLLLLGPL